MPEIGMYVCVSREKNLRGQPEELREFDQTSIHSKAKQRALLLLIFTLTYTICVPQFITTAK